ncbi:MAG: branched-chain amino acid ABC transporter permease [Thermodesulfobacteriota bacterium]|nr:branched-chain amino acid ABC transporter permease [Thermodesulfobacteriota bacterium]
MKRIYFLLGFLLLILLLLPVFVSDYILGVFVLIFFYAYLGQCWNVLTGYAGPISLGHSLYVGIGAYISTKLAMDFGLSPWIGMWIGALGATLIGLAVGFLGFRFGLKGIYFVLLTIAFAEIGRLIALHLKPLGHMMGLFIDFKPGWVNFHFKGNLPYYYIGLGYVVFSLIVVRAIEASKWGRYFVALREDEDAAESIGINAFKYKMIAIGISSFLAALGGTFYANYIFYLHPTSVMSMWVSIEIIMRPIIGGLGTPFGPLIGSLLLTPLSEIARSYFTKAGLEGIHVVIYGFLLVAAVLFFPGGIFSYIKKILKPLLGSSKEI